MYLSVFPSCDVQLLQTDPSKRLGSGASGSDEIKRHNWFKSIDWNKLQARKIEPTFKPHVNGNSCTANFDVGWINTSLNLTTVKGLELFLYKYLNF